ncbi:hypothetical protein EMCRGX_G022261 [Ephydatia muelleri]
MSSSSPPEYETVRTELRVKGLPSGWKREVVVRKNGQSAGKTDVYYFSPCGKKFRSKPQIARFLGDAVDLTCFDFSRAGSPGDGTQRRRARDRNLGSPGGGGGGGGGAGGHHSHSNGGTSSAGNIVTRRSDHKPSSGSKPLSTNPLRPSGPVRRTCGVIKLPVIWVAPPNNEQVRDECVILDQKRDVAVHVVVQTHWERRLGGFKPCDHATGSDIAFHRVPNGTVDGSATKKPAASQQTPAASASSKTQSSVLSHLPTPFLTSASPVSSLASQSPRSTNAPAGPPVHSGTDTLSANGPSASQQQTHSSTHSLVSNGSSAQTVELSLPLVTESVVRAQEERVRLIRQQLLAAQSISS